MGTVSGLEAPALITKRFDRTNNGQRIHFEEFNQLLGFPSNAKIWTARIKSMADFYPAGRPAAYRQKNYRLYLRILAGFVTG